MGQWPDMWAYRTLAYLGAILHLAGLTANIGSYSAGKLAAGQFRAGRQYNPETRTISSRRIGKRYATSSGRPLVSRCGTSLNFRIAKIHSEAANASGACNFARNGDDET